MQTIVVYFLGENGSPLGLCIRLIDKGGPGQCYNKMSFVKTVVLLPIFTLSGSSVLYSWTMDIHFEGRWFESA